MSTVINPQPPIPLEMRTKLQAFFWRAAIDEVQLEFIDLASEDETLVLEFLLADLRETAGNLDHYLSYFRV